MIDTTTLNFMLEVNRLAGKTKYPILPFSEATKENKDSHIFYNQDDLIGTVEDQKFYPIVLDSIIDEEHHDVISYLDARDYPNTRFEVVVDADGSVFIQIQVIAEDFSTTCIIIEDGEFYRA